MGAGFAVGMAAGVIAGEVAAEGFFSAGVGTGVVSVSNAATSA